MSVFWWIILWILSGWSLVLIAFVVDYYKRNFIRLSDLTYSLVGCTILGPLSYPWILIYYAWNSTYIIRRKK